MFHTRACDGEQSVCGCCDCAKCETHSELTEMKYESDYQNWLDKLADSE